MHVYYFFIIKEVKLINKGKTKMFEKDWSKTVEKV